MPSLCQQVQPRFCCEIGGSSFSRGIEVAKVELSAANAYAGLELSAANSEADANQSGRTGAALLVLHIPCLAYVAQVLQTVVGPIPIDVVNLRGRPRIVNMQPRKSMRSVDAAHHLNADVSVRFGSCASLIADVHARAGSNEPEKESGRRVVLQKLAQTRAGKIDSSHDAVHSQSGQKSLGVSSTNRLRYFRRGLGQ